VQCDKCGGLVVRDEDEELKCVACDKRFYKPESAITRPDTLREVGASKPAPRRCVKILAVRGTQCSANPTKGSQYCLRHSMGGDGLKDMTDTVLDEEMTQDAPTMTKPMNGKSVPATQTFLQRSRSAFMPVQLEFICTRSSADWMQFIVA